MQTGGVIVDCGVYRTGVRDEMPDQGIAGTHERAQETDGFAWIGHFMFEKNKPASFKRPLYSLMGDWVMYKDIWTGKIRF